MSLQAYHRRVEDINQRLNTVYSRVGGSFFFYWVDNVEIYQLRRHTTADFDDNLHEGRDAIVDFFHRTMVGFVRPTFMNVNLWRTSHRANLLHVMPPRQLENSGVISSRIRRHLGMLNKLLDRLCAEHIPFIFYYRPMNSLGANHSERHQPIVRYFPDTAGNRLVTGVEWSGIVNPSGFVPIAGQVAAPMRQRVQATATQRVASRNNRNTPLAEEYSMGENNVDGEEDIDGGRGFDDVLDIDGAAGMGIDHAEAPIDTLYHTLVNSLNVPVKVLCKDAQKLYVVLPNLQRNDNDSPSVNPVLVCSSPISVECH
jgi:hypothetical protein